jgi:cytochrome c oxidase subunit 2
MGGPESIGPVDTIWRVPVEPMAEQVRAMPPVGRGRRARTARHLAAVAALPATVAIGAAGCSGRLGLPESATTQGDGVVSLWRIFIILAAVVAGLIYVLTAATIISSLRRRRAGQADGIPEQHQYRTALEIFYTAMPLVIVAALLAMNFSVTGTLTNLSDRPDLVVKVVGFQWQWRFEYPDQHVAVNGDAFTLPQMWLPVGRTVRFDVTSPDVIHSFWVPNFLQKRDMIPGAENPVEVTVKEPGQWIGRCAEYCGLNHWQMKFAVCAVSPEAFTGWVRDIAGRPQPVITGVKADGSGPADGSPVCPSPPTTQTGFSTDASESGAPAPPATEAEGGRP